MNLIYPLSVYLKITQGYHSQHLGVDFGWNDYPQGSCNQAIIASESGTVVDTGDGYGNTYPNRRIYGNFVNIEHDDTLNGKKVYTIYAHLLKELIVKKGQHVRKGQVLGYMGNSGYSNGQHLHFELRVGSNRKICSIDPLDYLFIENPGLFVNSNTKFPDRIKRKETGIGTPVPRDTTKDQIEVITPTLNARQSGSLSGKILGHATMGIFNIQSESEMDNYTWAQIEPGIFIAEKEGAYTKRYAKETFATVYEVKFPEVSVGDKNYLVKVGDTLELKYEVSEKK